MPNSSTPKATHAFCSQTMKLALAVTGLLMLAIAAPAAPRQSNDGRVPDLRDCQNLHVQAGNKALFHVYAEGVQIYRWNGTNWIFVAPEAVLFANAGGDGVVGIHYAGPTWESLSGSKVVGTVLERCTPATDAIPWLLLGALVTEGPGILDRVTFIQRINTVGGLAPPDPGNTLGEVSRVPYIAEYVFYRHTTNK
jgi:hypothetical protein